MTKRLLKKVTELLVPGRGGARREADKLRGVNAYWRHLAAAEIASGEHRSLVGGLWDEIGKLQLEFLKA